jgi:hypothetical protein
MFLITLMDLLIVVGAGQMYGNCNLSGQTYNQCNDPDWCCVTEIYQLAQNGCANTIACPAQFPTLVSQLSANADFEWFFWTNIMFLIFDILALIFFAGQFYTSPKSQLYDDDPLATPPTTTEFEVKARKKE